MQRKLRVLAVLMVIVIMAVSLAGCGSTKTEGKLVVGTEASYAPFEYVDDKTGEIVGFDIELIKAIGEAINYEVEIRNIAWDALPSALLSKQVDVVISAMTITDERAKTVFFSDPYMNAGQIVAVKQGSDIKSHEDLSGKIVGVQANTTGHYAMEDMVAEGKLQNVTIRPYETTPDAFNSLRTGVVDAVVADDPVVKEYIKSNPEAKLTTAGSVFTVEYYGMAMRPDDFELHKKINQGLAKVKADGTYDKIYNKYFGE